MLYESDVNNLLSQWEQRLSLIAISQSYKDGVRDCMYELKTLMNDNFKEETLAQEAFEQKLMDEETDWKDYFNNLLADGMFEEQ